MQDRIVEVDGEMKQFSELKVNEISFDNSHLVAEMLMNEKPEAAEALMLEIQARLMFRGENDGDNQ